MYICMYIFSRVDFVIVLFGNEVDVGVGVGVSVDRVGRIELVE